MTKYVESHDGNVENKVDIKKGSYFEATIVLQGRQGFTLQRLYSFLVSVFLPQGYPKSVSEDYLSYQKWDTIQAFASSMTGALATEAVLRGAGVGDQNASVLATSLTWLVKDGLGMIGRISFTYFRGTDLDSNPKKWRLAADILNDLAFFVDLLSPAFPHFFFPFACFSSLCRCVVGVAGGATRTAIVQHQAIRNNLADVAAKDGSQETLVNVVALISSLILLPIVSGKQQLVWCLYMIFTIIHLYSNYRAVKNLSLKSLNKNRAAIAIRAHLSDDIIPNVDECNQKEPLFYSIAGSLSMGCSLLVLSDYYKKAPTTLIVETEQYFLGIDKRRNNGFVVVSQDVTDQLLPFYHMECLVAGKDFERIHYENFKEQLTLLGYDLSKIHLGYDSWTFKKLL